MGRAHVHTSISPTRECQSSIRPTCLRISARETHRLYALTQHYHCIIKSLQTMPCVRKTPCHQYIRHQCMKYSTVHVVDRVEREHTQHASRVLTFSLRASGAVHFTGSFIPSDFWRTSRVNPKSDTLAVLSSAISTFLAAKSLSDGATERERERER